jgi:pyruvate formate lyase activating enzyme
LHIKGFIGTSLIDYPGVISSIIFLGGCDFKCPFCQNPELVDGASHIKDIPLSFVLKDLEKRKDFVEGVVITGGEPTIYKNLSQLILPLKEMGFLIKLDTNGNNPEVLSDLLDKKLVDYIAMDVKSSPDMYKKASGVNTDIKRIQDSVKIIMESCLKYEFRVTVVPTITDETNFEDLIMMVKGASNFYIQQYREILTYDKSYKSVKPFSPEELNKFKSIALPYVKNVEIRGL